MAIPNPDLELLQQPDTEENQEPIEDPQEVELEQEKAKSEAEDREDRLNTLLLDLVKKAEKEDEDIRYALLAQWRRNDLYFNNIQKIFLDSVAQDYRTLDQALKELEQISGINDVKIINIYRPFVESLVAALSVATPSVEFIPDDAEDPDDIETAQAYSHIAELTAKHNHNQLMLIKGLVTLYNCGTIAGYNYYKTDPAYGIIKKPGKVERKPVAVSDIRCQQCGELTDTGVPLDKLQEALAEPCAYCGGKTAPLPQILYVDEVTEYEETPKGRSCFDIFGPNYVKLPIYARNQASCGYLILRVEDHVAKFKTVYENEDLTSAGGDTQLYERWARVPIEYAGLLPPDLTTLRSAWFRPWYFNTLATDDAELLLSEYPNGCMVSVIGEIIVEVINEKLDDRWTISIDPKSNYIHAEPAGNAIIPLQDSENDIFNLGLQSIEFGIPETFANPKTLNFKKYRNSPSAPGMVTPALPPAPDKAISDGFHTVKTATLSNEYTTFAASLTTKAQFVTGAFPSLFGGNQEGSGNTATQYTESKNRALQRLQLTWQTISVFWCDLQTKVVTDYAKNLREDERFAQKQKGTFVNVWIRKSSLNGKVGHVEPETNGQLPQSWSQKKDFFMSLVQLQDPIIGKIIMDPNNTENIKLITGMPDFYLPGEEDRAKQYEEFFELSVSEPIGQQTDNPDMEMQGQEPQQMPSVMIDIDVDDHVVHMAVLKHILVSSEGRQLYKTAPASYQNCILHYRAHEMAQQAKTIAPSGTTGANEPAESAASTTQG